LKSSSKPLNKKSSAVQSYANAKDGHSVKEKNNDHTKDLDMNQMIQAINIDLLIKLNKGSKTYSSHIPWNLIQRNSMVDWPDGVPVKKIMLQGRKNLKVIYASLDSIQFTEKFLNDWATRLGNENPNEQSLPSLPDAGGDDGSTGGEFFDRLMNHDQSLEGLEFLSDDEENFRSAATQVGDSVSLTRKRTIHDLSESPDMRLPEGISLKYNRKSILIIQIIFIMSATICL